MTSHVINRKQTLMHTMYMEPQKIRWCMSLRKKIDLIWNIVIFDINNQFKLYSCTNYWL